MNCIIPNIFNKLEYADKMKKSDFFIYFFDKGDFSEQKNSFKLCEKKIRY